MIVLKVLSDILSALDSGNIAMLTLLDLSAAFDSVDHNTLLQRLGSHKREGHRLVYVISQRPITASSHNDDQLGTICSFVWSASRFSPRADLVPTLHCGLAAAC